MRAGAGAALLLQCLSGACVPAPGDAAGAGRLQAEWTGSSRGEVSGSARAEWCRVTKLLEIRSIMGDTGIALAVYPPESVVGGKYPIVDHSRAEAVTPSASLALRWFAETTVEGFQADSGWVVLERSPENRLSGTIEARVRSVADTKRLSVTGAFADLAVMPAARGCLPETDESGDEDASPGGTGIH